ncbi:unnamed protein product [Phaeothamnion confervicola]
MLTRMGETVIRCTRGTTHNLCRKRKRGLRSRASFFSLNAPLLLLSLALVAKRVHTFASHGTSMVAALSRRAPPTKGDSFSQPKSADRDNVVGSRFRVLPDGKIFSSGKSVVRDGIAIDGVAAPLKLKFFNSASAAAADRELDNLEALRRGVGPSQFQRSFVGAVTVIRDHQRAGQHVLVMEAGTSDLLHHIERTGPVGGRELRRWARATATVLTVIHRTGLIWTDLKPENLVLMTDGKTVKAIDLESAVRAGAAPVDCSPAVAPPEAALAYRRGPADVRVDAAYDAWSLGMTLLHLKVGKSYWEHRFGIRGNGGNAQQIMQELCRPDFTVDLSCLDEIGNSIKGGKAEAEPQLRTLLAGLLSSDPRRRVAALRTPSWYLNGPML